MALGHVYINWNPKFEDGSRLVPLFVDMLRAAHIEASSDPKYGAPLELWRDGKAVFGVEEVRHEVNELLRNAH